MDDNESLRKMMADKFYKDVFLKYGFSTAIEAGFVYDSFNDKSYYNLNALTTPFDKLNMHDVKNPVVLLSTGGFTPIHAGHIKMMELAKQVLNSNGYNVIGGYISPSHDNYAGKKPYNTKESPDRVYDAQEAVKNNNWIMIDPWESLYVSDYINFTDVIERLEQYLKKHINPKIRVAYVFGDDNIDFMYCFENKGIGICVERNGSKMAFGWQKHYFKKYKNCFFIENKSKESKLSSIYIRKSITNNKTEDSADALYAVRNESIIPLNYLNEYKNKLSMAQKMFLNGFLAILKETIQNKIIVLPVNKQIESFKENNVISLDPYFSGEYNIDVSRLFPISSPQISSIALINRPGSEDIDTQINKIKPGNYCLVDDDSATGTTIQFIKSKLPKNVIISKTCFLTEGYIGNNEKLYDIIDLRDFIFGAKDGGLVVKLPNNKIVRTIYSAPYVSLPRRAKIPAIKEKEFSRKVWELNKKFYEYIDCKMALESLDKNTVNLMLYMGFKLSDKVVDICDYHINLLS